MPTAHAREWPSDILELVFAGMDIKEYHACRRVCKTWHLLLTGTAFLRVVRSNALLSISDYLQAPRSRHGRALHLLRWHGDVFEKINEYIRHGGDNNVFCFYSHSVSWGRTCFTAMFVEMGFVLADVDTRVRIGRYAKKITSQLFSTVRKGFFPVVVVDMKYYQQIKQHYRRLATIIQRLKCVRIFGILVPVVVLSPFVWGELGNFLPKDANVTFMWKDTGFGFDKAPHDSALMAL